MATREVSRTTKEIRVHGPNGYRALDFWKTDYQLGFVMADLNSIHEAGNMVRTENDSRHGSDQLASSSGVSTIASSFDRRSIVVACPFFIPTERTGEVRLPHPRRLPLGTSWRGLCSAPGHEQEVPTAIELASCNLGYAHDCPRLPRQRPADAVRFGVVEGSGEKLRLEFVFEADHLPAGHGFLDYDRVSKTWISPHADARLLRLAVSFLELYLEGKTSPS
jgi:hypothetical protein